MRTTTNLLCSRFARARFARIAHSCIESLEARQLLSAVLSGSTLKVTGSGSPDTFTLSDSGSTITVKQNATTYTFADGSVANISVNPNAGDDTINILSNTKPITVTDASQDTLNIGNAGSTQAIHAEVTYVGTFQASLSIDDSKDSTGHIVVDNGGIITGIAPAPIHYSGDVRSEVISSGSGNDSFTLQDGAPDEGTIINGGAGNDSLFLGDGNFDDDSSTVYFDGGAGSNATTIDDSSASSGDSFTNTTGNFTFHFNGATADYTSGDVGGSLAFVNVQQASMLLGSGNDSVTTDPSFAVPLKIHGGAGNDSLQGGSGNDSLFGDSGNDTLNGETGNDYLNGGQGADSLLPSTGIDTLDGGDGAPIQIVADNIASAISGTSQGVTVTGSWVSSTSTPGFYAGNYITDNNSGKGSKSVKFTPTLPTAGSYQVFARWISGTNRSNHVPFDVLHQGSTTTVFENQQTNNGAWVSLGTYSLSAGTSSSVTIRNAGTSGYVIADAVRFVPVTATASISGTVFNDANGNAVQNSGETGVHGRTVYIDSNKNGILDSGEPSTTTDSAGYWQFTGLAAGTYRIREQNIAGIKHTDPVGTANFYDVAVTTGASASAIYGKLFGDQVSTPNPAPKLAINVGGTAFILNSGITYAADSGFTGGTAATSAFDVAGTDNDPIYYSTRSGTSFSYSLAVPNGNYNLVLNFVDPTMTAAGQRKFNVTVEGKQVLTNFDIVATAGAKTATSKSFAVTVTGGKLTISLKSVVGNAILSGIILYPA